MSDYLSDPSLTIIFASSPTGLGHLRVTKSLYRGLPKTAMPLLLGAQDPTVTALYRFISIHPIARKIMELVQIPPFDKSFAYISSKFLRSRTDNLYQQLKSIMNERLVVPKNVLLVACHASLAHQLGEIKQKIANEMGTNVLLVVQVTDDSPQPIWYIHDADLIVVPSKYTKEKLSAHAKTLKFPIVPIETAAYPIAPSLSDNMSDHDFKERLEQVDPTSQSRINVSIPISGAAVGTSFISTYIDQMHKNSSRFAFHVVTRQAPFTDSFIHTMVQRDYVNLHVSDHDRTTVDNYENLFKDTSISLEVTKPSEQAFKALATPKQRGGVILLLSKPVGRQEYDNLHFLRNHGLLPSKHENKVLWEHAEKNSSIKDLESFADAHNWRALRLPEDPYDATVFTSWCLREKLFARMMHYIRVEQADEIKSNGVEQFWTYVERLIKSKR